jgi:hypothetical protein
MVAAATAAAAARRPIAAVLHAAAALQAERGPALVILKRCAPVLQLPIRQHRAHQHRMQRQLPVHRLRTQHQLRTQHRLRTQLLAAAGAEDIKAVAADMKVADGNNL